MNPRARNNEGIDKFKYRRAWRPRIQTFSIIIPILCVFCLAFVSCGSEEPSPPLSENPNARLGEIAKVASQKESVGIGKNDRSQRVLPRIVAFGDSLTAGLGVSPDEAYPSQLERWLGERGIRYEVINAGVSGETTAGGVRRVEWILKTHPRLVILELGANDGLRGHPLDQTYENLKAIITRLQAEKVQVVLAGMQIPLNYGQAYTQEFSGIYPRLARELDIPLIPFFLEGVAARSELNQGDGIHPTVEGYGLVVQNVGKTLIPILKELEKGKAEPTPP